MRSPDPSLRPEEPEKTSKCWCGCGELTKGHFATGHDARAKGILLHIHYGSTAALLEEHGYGSNGDNLSERHAEKCNLPPGEGKKRCRYR